MSHISIRTSHENDTNAIFNLVQRLSPLTPHSRYTYWNLFKNFGDACFVLLDKNKAVGFITSHPTTTTPTDWFIWQVGILPKYRAQGLVDDLINNVIGVAKKSGSIAIITSIETNNLVSFSVFNRLASRFGTDMAELEQFNLNPKSASSVPEVLYRISLIS